MDTTLPDAGPAQTSSSAAQGLAPPAYEAANGTGALAPRIKVDDPPKFEVESYIANYTGRTRFHRLYLIGTTSTLLATDVLKAAVAEAKSGKNVELYEKAVRALSEVAPTEPEASLDSSWVQEVQRSVRAQTDRLEHELRGYKNNLIKESIRMGNEDLGNHFYETGELIAAAKAYSRMRDYCTTPNHIANMLFKLINVGIEREDWLNVQSNVHRLRSSAQTKPDEHVKDQPKMMAAQGLALMHARSYYDAATSFLSTESSLADTFNEVITPNDVAVYGGLCALASMDRNELQRRVLENSSFRNFLELEPHIRRAIGFFCNSKFRPCLDILESYRVDYLLDVHLQRHVSELYSRIRVKSIEQYLVPFSRVTLDSMATIFAPNVVGGEAQPTGSKSPFVKELIDLIKRGVLDARIDLEKGVLVSNETDLREEVQTKTLESMRAFNEEAHIRLLHTTVLQAGLQVPAAPKPGRRPQVDQRDGNGAPAQF
ncbi:COP9 signalosome subunit 1 (CsnA) [Penicillium atrosanguineum]|uniref:COP9 signalosome complex subunit 1 n=1 Tax=Penicillium atrosanguineum TaxID=1132637 RepID=A0A9W9PXC7_9EURO|nr:uncharacterized protein N7443_002886 [Penicillium atrosanguineum]KAJ5140512.1 COP9 signalosome subunit 1 (CsnA) [Penicillium atrosanguineum]KAJ5310425.1 hypothetical protein N7443_002886 [Penicillium atrosanguineum]KAJ5315945.1 COP9 signalosome subunit 1 (CsnA) [Penicillium atrosanguineum]